MVQFKFATSIAVVVLLVASVSSTPIPVKNLDINERDINELQSRNAVELGISGLTKAFKFLGRLKKSKAGHVAKHVNDLSGYVPQPQQQQQHRRRDFPAQLGRRAILERGWGYHNLGVRGYFDEND